MYTIIRYKSARKTLLGINGVPISRLVVQILYLFPKKECCLVGVLGKRFSRTNSPPLVFFFFVFNQDRKHFYFGHSNS